jgi:hypothetical protein
MKLLLVGRAPRSYPEEQFTVNKGIAGLANQATARE